MRPTVTLRSGALILALGLLASFTASPAMAAAITVNSLADTEADDGTCSLREAIIAANTDTASGASVGECGAGSGTDTITFGVSGTIVLTFPLPAIATDLSIDGAGSITVSGDSSYQVLDVIAGTVSLSAVTITAGNDPGTGGAGIRVRNTATLTVTGSTISESRSVANNGGGIFNEGGTVTVTNSVISGNWAERGAGIFNHSGTLTVTNSTISGNVATFLGGGGGIFNVFGTTIVTNSTISGNSAFHGGGLTNSQGTMIVTNSTISGNLAVTDGGGIRNGGTLIVTNSTISGNTAQSDGGGIHALDATETLENSIVAGNTGVTSPDISASIETITTSVIGVPEGMTLADILDPAGLADNGGPTQTIALSLVAGNPAVDLGTGAICAAEPVNALDQRGMPRPTACDIGAYEVQPPSVAAHPDLSVAASSADGAVVTYSPPAGMDEQGGTASVDCVPASGSTFAVGSTTVTCTATSVVGHAAIETFSVNVDAFQQGTATTSPAALPNTALARRTNAADVLLLMLGLIALGGWVAIGRIYRRGRGYQAESHPPIRAAAAHVTIGQLVGRRAPSGAPRRH